jgi:hypothetical protein
VTCIYAMKSNDLIKIGISGHPVKRFATIRTLGHDELTLIFLGECETRKIARTIEMKVHMMLEANCDHADWFRVSGKDVVEAITSIARLHRFKVNPVSLASRSTKQNGFHSSVGELLALAREINGITLRTLEEKTGISNALINQMETGHVQHPSFDNVVKVARALNLKIDLLARAVK